MENFKRPEEIDPILGEYLKTEWEEETYLPFSTAHSIVF